MMSEKVNSFVFIWTLLAAVAGVILMSIMIRLLLKIKLNKLAENETTATKIGTASMSNWYRAWPPWAK